LLAYRLLGDVQVGGRPGEAAVVGDGDEVAHLAQFGGRHAASLRRSSSHRDKHALSPNNNFRLFMRATGAYGRSR
jgi:hypothetical protein